MMRRPTKANTDSMTRKVFSKLDTLRQRYFAFIGSLTFKPITPCSHHQESGLLGNSGGRRFPTSDPVTAQTSLARARRGAAQPMERALIQPKFFAFLKTGGCLCSSSYAQGLDSKSFLSYEEIHLEGPKNRTLSFFLSFMEKTTQV